MTTSLEATKTLPQIERLIKESIIPFDVIIIGGGPAGLTAGIYCTRNRLHTLMLEKAMTGGAVATTDRIANYPGFPISISGMELCQRMTDQAKKHGLEIVYGQATGIQIDGIKKRVICEDNIFTGRTLIIASGTSTKKLGVPGEDRLHGRGVSYCAVCDGPFYQDKKVAVIGGGNAAIEEALFLTKFAREVIILHRRDQLRADAIVEESARENPAITFFWSSVLEEIKGKDYVEEIVVRDLKNNQKTTIEIDGVFIYIGEDPNTAFLQNKIKLDETYFILTDEEMKTNLEGVFAAGDVRKKPLRQIATAVSDGAVAAISAAKYLDEMKKIR